MKPALADNSQIITREFFEQIYRVYWRRVYSICLSKTGEKEVAEEMVQDIFCSIWERRDSLVIQGPVENYLVRAAKLEVAAYYRKTIRRESILNDVLHGYEDKDETTDQVITAKDLSKSIDNLLFALPEQSRQIFIESRQTGASNKEIAARFLISIKTVEYHISKTLLYLRTNLHELI